MAKFIYGVQSRGLGLQALSEALLGLQIDKSAQLSDWSAPELSNAQINYAALDAVLALRLFKTLTPKIVRTEQTQAYTTYRRLIGVIAQQYLVGVPFDADGHKALSPILDDDLHAATLAVKCALPGLDNPGSPKQLSEWLESRVDTGGWKRGKKGWLRTDEGTLLDKAGMPAAGTGPISRGGSPARPYDGHDGYDGA